jgi:DNA-binding transcriptional LysR family regulator
MITFKELKYVTLVNKYKNFSQAAKHAGVSQPALSMAISKLEEKLDTILFYLRRERILSKMSMMCFCA